MALIEHYHLVADYYPVSTTNNPNIIEGMLVKLNNLGNAVQSDGSSGERVLGVAGDTSDTTTGRTPYAADLVLSPSGETRSTSNRVSDFFNETTASGKITVYTGGGKFHTDQFETLNGASPITYTPGDALYASANSLLTNVASASAQIVATLVVAPRAYPSGVPGTDTTDGSISLGSYLTFVLHNH